MSIFGTILSKILPGHHPAPPQAPAGSGASTAPTGTAPTATATSSGAPPAAAPAAAAPAAPVDVEAILKDMAAKNGQQLNWRSSIVDLMKLLQLDSSLASRKELAHELGYAGDTNDSATMNVWLHKQVMRKLAENGGHVPADLKD